MKAIKNVKYPIESFINNENINHCGMLIPKWGEPFFYSKVIKDFIIFLTISSFLKFLILWAM